MLCTAFSFAGNGNADDTPPSISGVKWNPTYPNEGDRIKISATITDESGVAMAQVSYCIGDACYVVEMSGSNGQYLAYIGPFDEGTITFHIIATDTVGNTGSTGEYTIKVDGTKPDVEVLFPNGGENLLGFDLLLFIGLFTCLLVSVSRSTPSPSRGVPTPSHGETSVTRSRFSMISGNDTIYLVLACALPLCLIIQPSDSRRLRYLFTEAFESDNSDIIRACEGHAMS